MSGRTGRLAPRWAGSNLTAWTLVSLAGLGGWLLSFMWVDHDRVWRALLISYLYFTSLAGGLVVWMAMIHASGGRWADKHLSVPAAGIVFFLPSLLVILVLWLSSSIWAPWYKHLTPQGFWLDNAFLFGRQVVLLLLFWCMAWFFLKRRGLEKGRAAASFFILLFTCYFSLLGFDLVMALDYHWHSSLFGGYFFISALYIAIAAWGLIAAWQRDTDKKFRSNVASLLLSFSILTTYTMFCQLLPIWYENLPNEVRFLYDRLHFSPARQFSLGILVVAYLGPLFMLLTRAARQSRVALGLSSAVVLVAMWVERWWLVAPTFSHQPSIGIAEIFIAVCMLGILGSGMILYGRMQRAGAGGGS